VAYDHSRVILRAIDGLIGSDYINANYLDGYRKQNAYIATQGPLPNTFADFWRMIWETNSVCIVMMTKLEERNRLKCDQYWPSRGTETYGSIQVTLTDLIELASYSIRTFTIAWVRFEFDFDVKDIQSNDFRLVIQKNEKFDIVNLPLGLVKLS
jgi:netrin-G3 ligand